MAGRKKGAVISQWLDEYEWLLETYAGVKDVIRPNGEWNVTAMAKQLTLETSKNVDRAYLSRWLKRRKDLQQRAKMLNISYDKAIGLPALVKALQLFDKEHAK